jgi:predicted dehydrogenase
MSGVKHIGLIGLGSRGKLFLDYSKIDNSFKIVAICDIDEKTLNDFPISVFKTVDYKSFIDLENLDAVYVATPPKFHAEISAFFLQHNISVLCEVPACLNENEADLLKNALKGSSAIYMMAENYVYIPENLAIQKIIKAGKVGEIIFVEGMYVHDCKELFIKDGKLTWRGEWNTDNIKYHYPTHSLGPICRWLDIGADGPDYFDKIVNYGTKSSSLIEYFKENNINEKATQPDIVFSIITTKKGVVIHLRYDTKTNRPSLKNGFEIQGTRGWIKSGRYDGEEPVVYYASKKKIIPLYETEEYKEVVEKFPFDLKKYGKLAVTFMMFNDFLNSLRTRKSAIPLEDAILWSSPIWSWNRQ